MLDGIFWIVSNIGLAFWNLGWAVTHPGSWLSWLGGIDTPEAKEALIRFIFYGGSHQFFFVILVALLILTTVGIIWPRFMWAGVRGLEAVSNGIGRVTAWAGLIMVLQQTIIVFMQRIFASANLSFGFGGSFTRDISWWSEELKLWNALIVCLCVTWTFIQGGHVRVDLIYAPISFRAKKIVDMVGSVIFMMPFAVIVWMYGWYFMWRNLVNPPVSASDSLDRMMLKARAVRWSVETIGFSPNGFDAYFVFKILMVLFAGLVFLQGVAVLWRSFLEFREGQISEGRYHDPDNLESGVIEMAAPEHLARERGH